MVEIMSSADPVKLYEYFALGRPEVSTPNKHLATFYDGRLLRMKDTAEEFVDAIAKYLAFDDPNWQRERKQIAHANAWSKKASFILNYVHGLDKRRL